jgi:hypothetical protein
MKTENKNFREAEIEKYFVWAVALIGGKTYKFKSISQRGVADRIACLPNGDTWFVEVKRPKGGVLSPLQDLFAEEMWTLKQHYVCMWTKEDVDQWLTELKL